MPKNVAFFVVIGMVGLAALLFTFKSGGDIYRFWRLDTKVPIEALSFETKTINEDNYILIAHYRVRSFDHEEELAYPVYKNPYAAEKAAEQLFRETQSVWIDSSAPSVTALHKEISYKEFSYMLVLWGLTFYFLFLRNLST